MIAKQTSELFDCEAGSRASLTGKSAQALANKHSNYWAKQRQNLALLYRANIPESTIDAVRSELRDILDSSILIYPPTLLQLGIHPEQSFIDKKQELGIKPGAPELTENEVKFLRSMELKADMARRLDWQWRISQEHVEKTERGWYPFFVTLTVDPQIADPEEVWREGKALRKYIRDLCKVVTDELGHPEARKKTKFYDYRPESDYITYVGVVEHGASRKHHHGHFLIWMREIPNRWKQCPNQHIANPACRTRQQCLELNSYWPYSQLQVKSKYFRSLGDVWEREGFAIPLVNGKPQKIAPANIAGAYLCKYITKDFKQWKHRIKATRNLGKANLRNWIKAQTPEVIEALTWRPQQSNLAHIVTKTHTVPLGLIRSEAKRRNFLINFSRKQLVFRDLLVSNTGIYSKMLRSVRLGIRPDRMHSMEFYDWVGKFLSADKGYCEERLKEAHSLLSIAFPREWRSYDHVKIGANNIGHS